MKEKEKVYDKCEQLRREMEQIDSTYEKGKVQERLARLRGSIAVVKVGASTETEMKDLKFRLEDAINATKFAIEEGVVPGGGATLFHLSEELSKWIPCNLVGDEFFGGLIIERALKAPLKSIVSNAGYNETIITEKVRNSASNIGFNAESGTIENMFQAGIIDPLKVTRSSFQNAISIASMLISTECLIIKGSLGLLRDYKASKIKNNSYA